MSTDPKRPTETYKWEEPEKVEGEEDLGGDGWQLISMSAGIIGMMMRYPLLSWVALFATLASIATAKSGKRDVMQTITSITFASMGLVTNYIAPQGKGGLFG
jgi:hypothetical protein